MQKQKRIKRLTTPVRREIRDNSAQPAPGALGQAAVAAAALHQLNRCAREIEAFVEASKMERLVNEIQADPNAGGAHQARRLRIRGD